MCLRYKQYLHQSGLYESVFNELSFKYQWTLTRKKLYQRLLENNFGFKRLVENLKPNVKHHGVAIKSMYLIFKQDMIFQNVKVEQQI